MGRRRNEKKNNLTAEFAKINWPQMDADERELFLFFKRLTFCFIRVYLRLIINEWFFVRIITPAGFYGLVCSI